MSRAPATWATVVAFALINVGVATAIVSAMGRSTFAPLWVGLLLLVAGVAAAVTAVIMWRRYALSLRQR